MKNFFRKKSKGTKKEEVANPKMDWYINESILTFNNGDAYMHYFNKETEKNVNDPAWQNQGIYFWTLNESFEKKSLPDEFLTFEKRTFLINQIPEYITVAAGKAMPWFGKPGGGDKFFFRYENQPITLEEAEKLKVIFYVDYVTLSENNLGILNDRDSYQFQLDASVEYKDKEFYYNDVKIALAELYHKGLLRIMKLK